MGSCGWPVFFWVFGTDFWWNEMCAGGCRNSNAGMLLMIEQPLIICAQYKLYVKFPPNRSELYRAITGKTGGNKG